jgi:transcriptional regulator with XRE-family HTH domain
MGNRLKSLRENKRWTQDEAAELFGMSTSGYIKLENGQRKMTEVHQATAARVFGVRLQDVLEEEPERLVEIVGLAGAGPDGSVLFAEGDQNFGHVPAPADATENTKALEVRGNSMYGIANDGWLLFYDERTEPLDEYIGEPCACWLPDGRVLIKIPAYGRQRGLYHLESVNAPPMYDQAVEYMALITDIKPRRAAQRYIRRNPAQPVHDIKVSR